MSPSTSPPQAARSLAVSAPAFVSAAPRAADASRPDSNPLAAASARPPSAHEQSSQDVFVFIDNSNVFHGAQLLADGTVDRSVRVSIKELIRWLELGRWVHTRLVAGSMRTEKIVQEWQKYDYKPLTTSHDRDAYIDELLHAQILRLITTPGQATGTIVLVTGDGNENHGRSSFFECVVRALDAGWKVELCSWSKCLNAAYTQLLHSGRYAGSLFVRFLDEKRSRLTFAATPLPGAPSATSSIATKAPHTGAPPLNPHASAVSLQHHMLPPRPAVFYAGMHAVPRGAVMAPSMQYMTVPPSSAPMWVNGRYPVFPGSSPAPPTTATTAPTPSPAPCPTAPATPPPLPSPTSRHDDATSTQSLMSLSSWSMGAPKGMSASPPPLFTKPPPSRLRVPVSVDAVPEVKPSPAVLEETKETRAIMRQLGVGSADPLSPNALLSPGVVLSDLADAATAGFGSLVSQSKAREPQSDALPQAA